MPASHSPYSRFLLSVMRIVIAFTFMLHGLQKMFGLFGGMGGHGARVTVFGLLMVAGILETAGGSLLLLGLFTRITAFILCGEMAFAYFHAHFPRGFWPIRNGGELPIIYCFVFLYLFAAGAGPISLDSVLRRRP